MKIILRTCLFILAVLQVNFGSTPITKTLGGQYICTYEETPQNIIDELVDKKNGFGYVINQHGVVEIVTIHGVIKTNHPLICELIASPAFQRLNKINQYGVCEYIKKPMGEPAAKIGYTRHQHSLGVLVIIARYSDKEGVYLLKEMISGLLHDISHTPFSHSTDTLLAGGFLGVAYQDKTLHSFMKRHGIEAILNKYGIEVEDILPEKHSILEQNSPNLCADRIEYNIYAGYKEGHLNYKEIKTILDKLYFKDGKWGFHTEESALIFAKIPIWNSQYRWGIPDSYITSRCLCDALHRAFCIGIITTEMFDCSLGDEEIWNKLKNSKDLRILERISQIEKPRDYFYLAKSNGANTLYGITKFRGCVAMVGSQSLNSLNVKFNKFYEKVQKEMKKGFSINPKKNVTPFDDLDPKVIDSYGVVNTVLKSEVTK